MQKNDQQNFALAIGLTLVVMMIAQVFLWGPQDKERREAAKEQLAQIETTVEAPVETPVRSREDVIATQSDTGKRIYFDADGVDGSILLRGARLDDVSLKRHFQTLKKEEEVHLLSPVGTPEAYYAMTGWEGFVNANTNWTLASGDRLTPTTPVTLTHKISDLVFTRQIEVDDDYMFTFTDTVENTGSTKATLRPYGVVHQSSLPDDWKPFYILHEGAIGVAGKKWQQRKYKNLQKKKELSLTGEGGWVGLTTKYWMTAIVPEQDDIISANAISITANKKLGYEARMEGSAQDLQPGQTLTYANRIFAGAKRVKVLEAYQNPPEGSDAAPVPRFTDAVDWGNFWFFTKPFFWLLNMFNGWFGNFGLAILALTVIVKAAFFPIQNKAYASMAKMRKLMPEMEEIKKRFAADKQRQQQEIMALYQREKANPFSGCLPLIPQMFVFYGLYKTLFVTLEMRHEPFFGWIQDLSAPDPTSFFNLFGLLPFDPGSIPLLGAFLAIGAWPLAYGVTMWLLQNLSPPPPDPTQRMMMQFLPIVFTVIFAGFAAGLVVYWTWSNVLSIAQQYFIMRRNGVETQFDKFLASRFGGANKEAG